MPMSVWMSGRTEVAGHYISRNLGGPLSLWTATVDQPLSQATGVGRPDS